MQGLDKFDFKINVIRNGVEKCTRFNINIELIFIVAFNFYVFLLHDLVKNLGKYDFMYLSQEFDSKVLDLIKQKGFNPFEYMSGFETYSKISDKE